MKTKENDIIKISAIVAIVATLTITVTAALILLKILPYDLIGGGRMGSYEKAAGLAVCSILIQVFLMYCTAVAADIISHDKFKKAAGIVLRVFAVYFVINIIMNLMGKTWFERVYASLICLVQIVCFIIIIRGQQKNMK